MALTIQYWGHSTITINTDGYKLIIDPFLAPHNPVAPISAEDVEVDYILISHGHGDHTASAAEIAKRTQATVISNFEVVTWLQNHGASNVHGMNTGGAYTFPFGRVKMTIAHHSSSMPDGSNGGNPCGLLIRFNDGTDVYFAGDTALTYDMKLIGEAGGVDLAFLPIGDNFTMGPEDAVIAAQWVQAKHVVPIHYDTFPVIQQSGSRFAEMLRQAAEIDCTVMKPGDELVFG